MHKRLTGKRDLDALISKKMQKTSKTKPVSLLLALCAAIAHPAHAYPPIEFQSCVESGIAAVYKKGLDSTLDDVEAYCDCALTKIIDEGKPISPSISYCDYHFGG